MPRSPRTRPASAPPLGSGRSGGADDTRSEVERLQAELERERIKSDAFASMSHEMRTLLAGITGLTGVLLDTPLRAEQRDYAERIRASGDALLSLIDGVLDYTRAEHGPLEIVDLDPRRLVEEVADLLAERAHVKGLELVAECAPGVPQVVRADAVRLRQVLLNLVGNAIKFTHVGEVAVTVSTAGVPPGGDPTAQWLQLTVDDTGVGISAEGQSRIFEPYRQADAAGRRYGGSGLGLAIAKELVEAMGGTIRVVSTPSVGSSFTVTVPVAPALAATGGRSPRTGPLGGPRTPGGRNDFHGKRALVVAQSDRLARSLAANLADIDVATERAVSLASAPPFDGFDVVFVDGPAPAAAAGGRARVVSLRPVGAPPAGQGQLTLAKPVRRARLLRCLGQAFGLFAERSERAVAPRKQSQEGARVLVVDDNEVNQKVTAHLLQKRGCVVDVVSDGAAAVESTLSQRYAVVFMDCHMPRFDGLQATEEIRRRERDLRRPRTPIVAMTADAREETRQRCLAVGMDDFLTKPLVGDDLAVCVERFARGKPGLAAAATAPASLAPPWTDEGSAPGPSTGSSGVRPAAAIDLAVVERLRKIRGSADPDLLPEVMRIFFGDAAQRLAALRAAIARGDALHTRHVAHTMKGSAAQLGARAVQSIAARIEDIAVRGDVAEAEPLVAELEVAIDLAGRALEELASARSS